MTRRAPRFRAAIKRTVPIVIAVLMASIGCQKTSAPSAKKPLAVVSTGKAPTDDECRAIGEAIEKAVNGGDAAALNQVINWDAINESCTFGIDAPEQFRKGFIDGLGKARNEEKGLSFAIVDAIKNGGSYTLLHSFTKKDAPRLLFRLLDAGGSINYHEYVLARAPDGKVKAADLYIFLSGEHFSETLRRIYIQGVAQRSGNLINRLTGADKQFAQFLETLEEMTKARQKGDFADVLRIYNTLKPESKMDRTALLLRLQAAQNLGDNKEYEQSIADYRKEYPEDECVNILSIDYYLLRKQYAECLACIDRLERGVRGDPYLRTLRAAVNIEKNDLPAARADVKKSLDADPELAQAYSMLVTIELKEKNNDEALRLLRLLRDKFQLRREDLANDPSYKEFVSSPEYQAFLKEDETEK